jgi:phosphatidylserine/phosphatidylglycerophosphate/cardiolipin synthase-like enzyme
MSTRQFLQTSVASRNAAREILQAIFGSELVAPSRCIWLVSPWLRDIPVLDNTLGTFESVAPDLPRDEVRLSRALLELHERGTSIIIATRPEDAGNRQVYDAIRAGLPRGGSQRVTQIERSELHAKGFVGDRFALTGSMNLTFNGLANLTELLSFQTDAADVEGLRVTFAHEYGIAG